jgi:hypothetical protein
MQEVQAKACAEEAEKIREGAAVASAVAKYAKETREAAAAGRARHAALKAESEQQLTSHRYAKCTEEVFRCCHTYVFHASSRVPVHGLPCCVPSPWMVDTAWRAVHAKFAVALTGVETLLDPGRYDDDVHANALGQRVQGAAGARSPHQDGR